MTTKAQQAKILAELQAKHRAEMEALLATFVIAEEKEAKKEEKEVKTVERKVERKGETKVRPDKSTWKVEEKRIPLTNGPRYSKTGPPVIRQWTGPEEKEDSLDKGVLMPGTWNISGDAYNTTSPREELRWGKTKFVIKSPISIAAMLKEIRDKLMISIEEVELDYVEIMPMEPGNVKKLKLRGTKLKYDLFGDQKYINQHPGQCVIDWIMAELSDTRGYKKKLTYDDVRVELDPNGDGVDVESLIDWLSTKKDISAMIFDPFGNLIEYHRSKERNARGAFLVGVVNNGHIYAITDEKVKERIRDTYRCELGDYEMKVSYVDAVEWDIKAEVEHGKMLPPLPDKKHRTLLVNEECVGFLVGAITMDTDQLAWNIHIPEGKKTRVTKFEHPITGQIVIAAPKWQQRKAITDQLLAETNYLGFRWANQSEGTIGRIWFEHDHGVLTPSRYGPQLLQIYEKTILKPLIVEFDVVTCAQDEPWSIDVCRKYTHILMTNAVPYSRFVEGDEVRELGLTETLVPGEYWVPELSLTEEIRLPADWRSLAFVLGALERKLINRNDLTLILPASGYYEAKAFQQHATNVHRKFPKEAKNLINHWVGQLGKQKHRSCKAAVTDSWEMCAAMVEKDKEIEFHHVGNVWLMKKYTERAMTTGFLPVYRTVVELGILGIHDMTRDIRTPRSIIIGYNVDSMKLTFPKGHLNHGLCSFLMYQGTKPGEYRAEQAKGRRGVTEISMEPGWKYTPVVWRDITPEQLLTETKGCLVTGQPGSGKSEMVMKLARREQKRTIAVHGWTCRTVENLNKRDPDLRATTLDHAYRKQDSDAVKFKKKDKVNDTLIDEFSMLQPKWPGLFWRQKCLYPEQAFYLFGDSDQTPPQSDNVERFNRIDYEKNALAWYLCNGTRCRLPYLGHRYDAVTAEKLSILKLTGQIDFGKKTLFDNPTMTLCLLPATRPKINALRFQHFSREKKCFEVNETKYYIGMPLIAMKNLKPRVINSHIFELIEKTLTGVKLRNKVTEAVIEVNSGELLETFRYGWCETIRRWQGGEIREPFNIIETERMTFNDINTAVGRTCDWKYIGVVPSDRVYRPVEYPHSCFKLDLINEIRTGFIYEKRNSADKLIYIGRTFDEVRREQEHRKKATNKDLAAALALPGVTTKTIATWKCTLRQLDDLETEYIYNASKTEEHLLNKQKVRAAEKANEEKKTVIVHKIVVTRFSITCDENGGRYRVRGRIHGASIQRDFRWGKCGKDAALESAKNYQAELTEKHCIGEREP